MAISQKAEQAINAKVWGISVRHIVYMALGAALYGGLSALTNVLHLPATSNVSLRPAIVIPLFFGVVFGPWVGFFSGAVGNLIGDFISGFGFNWNWDVGNGLMGLIAGLAIYMTWARYNNTRNIVIADVFSVFGILIGMGFASYSDIWVSKYTMAAATGNFVPVIITNLINGLILLPILLIAYNAAVRNTGRG